MNVSTQGELIITKFIEALTIREDLKPKTLKEYTGDLKQFIGWFEAPEHHEEDIIFCLEDVSTPTLTQYRDFMQRIKQLKPATINPVSYTHLRAHETRHDLVCRLLLEK